MSIYIFRAECLDDVFRFLEALAARHRIQSVTLQPDRHFPNVEVMLRTDGTHEQLFALADSIQDAHIIGESLECIVNPITPI